MPASTYIAVSKAVRAALVAVGLVPATHPVPGLAGWRRGTAGR